MKGLQDWIEIFRAGAHTDSSGKQRSWTDSDLDLIVSKYNEQKDHEAPVVIGHPKDNHPAFAWVESLKRTGNTLFAKLKDINSDFADMVNKGMFKKRSISLYPDMTLRHVAFLGAVPPAVKGLKDIAFAEGEYETYETNFNEKENKKMATIEELQKQLESLQAAFEAEKKTTAEFSEKFKTAEAENSLLKTQLKNMEANIIEAQKKIRRSDFQSFCESLEREGRITPAIKPAILDFMEIMQAYGEYEFSDGKKPSVDVFKDFLKKLPVQVEFKEIAIKGASSDKTLEQTIKNYMDTNKTDYKTAVIELSKENPNLFRGGQI